MGHTTKIYVLMQSKGGVGKSHIARLFANYAMEKGKNAVFYNCDNESKTLKNFFEGIKEKKPDNVKFADYQLLLGDGKFDVNKFDLLLEEISKLGQVTGLDTIDFVVMDMGARSSTELINYFNARAGVVEALVRDYGFVFCPVVAGGNVYRECLAYLDTFPKELVANSTLLFNTFNGDIAGVEAIKIPSPAFDLSALDQFKEALSVGFTPDSLRASTNVFRYPAFRQYLDGANVVIEKILKKDGKRIKEPLGEGI